jgi:acetyl esterase/lipase
MRPLLVAGVLLMSLVQPAAAQPPKTKVPDGVTPHLDLPYVENGHVRQKLDLYLPQKSDGPLPVLVWIHGGGWQAGDKANPPLLPYATKGYAVASVNYRLSQHAIYPAQIEDCKAAIRWLRANAKKFNLNPDKIGVAGASAGGHLVALLGTTGDAKELEGTGGNLDQPSRVQCVVDLFGPTDLSKMGGTHDNPTSPEAKLLGGPVQEVKEKVAKANPIAFVTKSSAPFLILHGDKDKTVILSQSEMLVDALKKVGVEVRLVVVAGAGHGGPTFMLGDNAAIVEEFFGKHLKGK